MESKPKVVALSASLRSARRGKEVQDLLDQLRRIPDEEAFLEYVASEAQIHYQQFIDAGREKGLAFDVIYDNLHRLAGSKGLSNSEIGAAATLWMAHRTGCEIDYVPLADHFGPRETRNLDKLEERLRSADGFILATPVYFGDRGSLAASFIDLLRASPELLPHVTGKPVAGVAVGAKRNGGQETTLIYQLAECASLGMLAVGNDSETTSQYGGTIVAGDIGEGAKDRYGLKTAMGVGRHVARIAIEQAMARRYEFRSRLRVTFWILQDANQFALNQVQELLKDLDATVDAKILLLDEADVQRCIACDICPTHVGLDEEYRCIIHRRSDAVGKYHKEFLDPDLIVPVAYSPRDRKGLHSNYQRFMERTRYLRRGDYLFTDLAVLPLVFEELGVGENMMLQILTSMIRHHTVLLPPAVASLFKGKILNGAEVRQLWQQALVSAQKLAIGRLSGNAEQVKSLSYNPVGYTYRRPRIASFPSPSGEKCCKQAACSE